MKTISGRVVSSKPISLSKASSVLSNFVSADNGASQAVSAFLIRASASFNELVQLHRELKPSRSERKHKKHRSENPRQDETTVDDGPSIDLGLEHSYSGHGAYYKGEVIEDNVETDSVKKRHKKKNSEFGDYQPEVEERENVEGEVGGVGMEEGKKERKKRKSGEVRDGGIDDSEERHRSKKKKRSKID